MSAFLSPPVPGSPDEWSAEIELAPDVCRCSEMNARGGHLQQGITLLDVHGALMVFAWLGLIPAAIFSARYLRSSWPERNWRGMKLWFHVHRSLNSIAVLLIAISTALAFYARAKWTGPWFGRGAGQNTCAGAWHSLFGLFAVILVIRQPFNALLRCSPDHPRRPLFNWMHRIAGLLAYLLAMVPLFIGVFVRRILHRTLSKWILVGFHVFLLLLVLAVEMLSWLEFRAKRQPLVDHDGDSECSVGCEGCASERGNAAKSMFSPLRHLLFGLLLFGSAATSTLLAAFILTHH